MSEEHEASRHLPLLDQPLPAGSKIDFIVTPKTRLLFGGRVAHGFGIVAKTPGGDLRFGWHSDSDQSDSARAALAAVLNSLEWVPKLCAGHAVVTIHAAEAYLYEHLLPKLPQWIEDPDRPNHDLLVKIHKALPRAGNVAIDRLGKSRFRVEWKVAKQKADAAIDRKLNGLAGQT